MHKSDNLCGMDELLLEGATSKTAELQLHYFWYCLVLVR